MPILADGEGGVANNSEKIWIGFGIKTNTSITTGNAFLNLAILKYVKLAKEQE